MDEEYDDDDDDFDILEAGREGLSAMFKLFLASCIIMLVGGGIALWTSRAQAVATEKVEETPAPVVISEGDLVKVKWTGDEVIILDRERYRLIDDSIRIEMYAVRAKDGSIKFFKADELEPFKPGVN